jgi:hypothetical protein
LNTNTKTNTVTNNLIKAKHNQIQKRYFQGFCLNGTYEELKDNPSRNARKWKASRAVRFSRRGRVRGMSTGDVRAIKKNQTRMVRVKLVSVKILMHSIQLSE